MSSYSATDLQGILVRDFLLSVFVSFICDKRVPQKLKVKFYRTEIRPAMLYGAEC